MDLSVKQLLPASLASRFKGGDMSWVYWGMLALVTIFAGFVVKNSVSIITASHTLDEPVPVSKGVRVNFQAYDKVVDRIQKAASFEPEYQNYGTPFRTKDQ